MTLHYTKLFSLIWCQFHFTGKCCNFVHVKKDKNIPSWQNARHCLGQNAHARGRFTPQVFSIGILSQTCDYCGNGYFKFSAVVHPYYLNYDCSYIPMYEIYHQKMFNYDKKNSCHHSMQWKHVWKYLQQICNSLLWISFFIWLCLLITDNVHVRFLVSKHLWKMVRYSYKMMFITQTGNALLCGWI